MSRRFLTFLWAFFFIACAQAAELTTLTYHDVLPDPGQDPYNVSRVMFVAQMDYLKQNAYQPVSLDFLERVRRGKAVLPDKAVLLTFDDGLRSYNEFVVPMLKTYGFPSVVSVVTAWASGEDIPPEYRERLMSWPDLQKLQKSPLVEIISHSHDLHRGIPSNPQGNEYAATVTRRYSHNAHGYESETEFRRRIRQDFETSVAKMKRYLNITPRAIAWPYGAYDQVLLEEMARVGISFHFTLENGPTPPQQFPKIKRIIVRNAASLASFIDDLQYRYRLFDKRIVEFSLDPFLEVSEAKQNELLSRLLDRLAAIRANTVILSPFTADRRQAFFDNRQMPVAADILNRTLHQNILLSVVHGHFLDDGRDYLFLSS